MKALLVVGLLALLLLAPGAVAAEDPSAPYCGDMGGKECAMQTASSLLGPCGPLYDNVKECDPTS